MKKTAIDRPFDVLVNPLGEIIYYDKKGQNFTDEKNMGEVLTLYDQRVVRFVYKLQTQHNNATHRIYARRGPRKNHWELRFVTEFVAFKDNWEAWVKIGRFAQDMGSDWSIDVMREEEHLDRWKNGDDAEWQEGPDHGRIEVQVEVVRTYAVQPQALSKWEADREAKALIDLIAKDAESIRSKGEELFSECGVGVI